MASNRNTRVAERLRHTPIEARVKRSGAGITVTCRCGELFRWNEETSIKEMLDVIDKHSDDKTDEVAGKAV